MKINFMFFLVLTSISLLAQNKGASLLSTASSQQSGVNTKTYAVVIGISDYQDAGIPDLRFADKDAEAFANYLRSEAGGKLDGDHLKVLINSKATMAQFANALDWLWEVCKEGDQAIIYFSGHGDVEKKSLTQPGFLLCWDAPARVYMAGGAFALPMLQEVVSTLSIQNKAKVIVITDACRSGTLAGSSVGGSQATAANLAKQFGNEIKIMSCQPNEYSIEGEQWGGGRGAFSYHLLDALYGMADNNNDLWVTLQEVGRYLEDHVTNEVAPVSQVPMVVGNRNERLASVDESLLSAFKSGKKNQTMLMSAIESKGIEEMVLSKVDTGIRRIHELFNNALKLKVFLEPENACANAYYEILIKEPGLARLHSAMKRNFAAALQDDIQQVLKKWLNTDLKELSLSKFSAFSKYKIFPRYLERTAELLGVDHYMYNILMSRKLFFEGYLMHLNLIDIKVHDLELGNKVLEKYRKALMIHPESSHIYYFMEVLHFNQFNQTDSAEYYAKRAVEHTPNWFLPYSTLGGMYAQNIIINNRITGELEKAREFLELAESLDSVLARSDVIHLNNYSSYYLAAGKMDMARELIIKAMQLYSSANSMSYNSLGNICLLSKQYLDAEKYYLKAIELDSTFVSNYYNLGIVYSESGRLIESEMQYKKSIDLDSNYINAYFNLGIIYKKARRFSEAKELFRKCFILDSTDLLSIFELGSINMILKQHFEAESLLLKCIQRDSTLAPVYGNLGIVYFQMGAFEKAEQQLKKALSIDSTWQNLWFYLGKIYDSQGREVEFEYTLHQVYSLDSGKTHTLNLLGKHYTDKLKFDFAKTYLLKSVKLDSINPYTWDLLGTLYYRQLMNAEAEYCFKRAIKIDSNFVNSLYNLAALYMDVNTDPNADMLLKRIIHLEPKHAEALFRLAILNARKKQFNQTWKYLDDALINGFNRIEDLEADSDLELLRSKKSKWDLMMKKYFLQYPKN
ncbi:MAG: caspase family protein [Saprospiraceae bacterium]|nr:caspase family protein [Saprospiraceae bacterium]